MDFSNIAEQIKGHASDCFLLVHPVIHGLEKARVQVLSIPTVSEIDIGRKLSAALLEAPPGDRGRTAQRWFFAEIDAARPGLLLCSHVDLLFEPGFGLDPLMLFRQAARSTRLIVLWPGDFITGDYFLGSLSYAVPEHSHYRAWNVSDPALRVIRLED
jgi:hypothetical protein